jgi:hypothetical protein
MSEKLTEIAKSAPPVPSFLHGFLQLLDKHVKKPMEGTVIDAVLFEPAKQYYICTKRLD